MTALVQSLARWNDIIVGIGRDEVIGFVPTMGALHKGHGALLETARSQCSIVVASIFVNPIQFDQKSDYDLYPRVLEDDVAFCTACGVDYVFAPSEGEMYPEAPRAYVEVMGVSEHLCGRRRPSHFRGVATVVLKLLQIVRPQFAFFGEKDYQQLAVVRRLVRDLNVPLQVVAVPTLRESDGLAMSSRNRRLSLRERAFAPCLYKSLLAARRAVDRGERSVAVIKMAGLQIINRVPEINIEYFDVVDPDTIRPLDVVERPVLVALAAWIGKTRLIDNVLCEPPARRAKDSLLMQLGNQIKWADHESSKM